MAADRALVNILFVSACLVFLKETASLKCRVEHDQRTQEGFHDVIRACMTADLRDEESNSNHHHHQSNPWQHRPQWGQEIPRFPTRERGDGGRGQDDEDEEGSREVEYNRNRPRGYRPRPRTRRAPPPRNNHFQPARYNNTRRHPASSSIQDVEPCAIHCIFRQMKMLDNSNQPDKGSVLGVMTGKLRDPALRDWLRDAISECFDNLESENQDTKCSMTKSFALCLEQKGQQNCEDWEDEVHRPGQSQKHEGRSPNKHRG